MSTSLKRLLEAEAGRTEISPAPVAAVVAGGQARVRRRRILSVAVAAAAAVLAIAIPIGLSQGGSDDKPIKRPEIGCTQLDGPWTDRQGVHFGEATAPRPPGGDVEVLTSTRDSAVYTSSDPTGKYYRIYELRRDGSVRQIGAHRGPLQADPTGRFVAWHDVAAGEIVVYDTVRRAEAGRQFVGRLGAFVNAVRGDTVVYTHASQTYVWRPARGDPEPLDVALPNGSFVADVGNDLLMVSNLAGSHESYMVDGTGRRLITFPVPTVGEFDPSGNYLALAELSPSFSDIIGWAVRDVGAPADTELTGYAGEIVQTSWDPSGSLILATVKHIDEDSVSPGDVLTFYRCDPATGDCMLIEGSTTTARVAAGPANFQMMLLLSTTPS